MAPDERRDGKQQATPDSGALSPALPNFYSGALSPSPAASLWDPNAIDREGRRNAEHIAIIVVVDLVPIQCHFRSSSSGVTTIAADGPRPIHRMAGNPTGVTVTGPALQTVATGPSTCKALACCLQGLGLLTILASKAVGCRHDASW